MSLLAMEASDLLLRQLLMRLSMELPVRSGRKVGRQAQTTAMATSSWV